MTSARKNWTNNRLRAKWPAWTQTYCICATLNASNWTACRRVTRSRTLRNCWMWNTVIWDASVPLMSTTASLARWISSWCKIYYRLAIPDRTKVLLDRLPPTRDDTEFYQIISFNYRWKRIAHWMGGRVASAPTARITVSNAIPKSTTDGKHCRWLGYECCPIGGINLARIHHRQINDVWKSVFFSTMHSIASILCLSGSENRYKWPLQT